MSETHMSSLRNGAAAAAFLTNAMLAAVPAFAGGEGVPTFDHQFVIMMENRSYNQIIGDTTNAPFVNWLANTYALATNYYSTTHPSLPNYLDLIAGANWGVGASFDPYKPSTSAGSDASPAWSSGTPGATTPGAPPPGQGPVPVITYDSLANQLDAARLSWKAYEENIPAIGSNWANSTFDGLPSGTVDQLYAVKHNPFAYFDYVQRNDASNMVGFEQLTADLNRGTLPAFSFIAPNQCNDMHGDSVAGTKCYGYSDAQLIQAGDAEIQKLVTDITSKAFWSKGKNVIYVVWDEGGSNNGPNQVALIAITNYNYRALDNQYGNHYALLRTIEDGFGIDDHLNNAGKCGPLTSMLAPKPN